MRKKAIIFGSGSIACRHSIILNDLDFKVVCATKRNISLSEIYHSNSFADLVSYHDAFDLEADIYVIAGNTSEHERIAQCLIEKGISREFIFCEKPGPNKNLNITILYNLRFIKFPENMGKPLKIVHCSNAKEWPTDLNWKNRYVFRKNLGGGVFSTHSHELVHCFENKPKFDSIQLKNSNYILDIDGNKLCTMFEGKISGIDFYLDLLSEDPKRYWEHENFIFHFYGKKQASNSNKKHIFLAKKDIDMTYKDMWRFYLQKTSNSNLIKDLTWVNKIDS